MKAVRTQSGSPFCRCTLASCAIKETTEQSCGSGFAKKVKNFFEKWKNIPKKELTKQPYWYNEVKLKDITFGNDFIDFRRFPL